MRLIKLNKFFETIVIVATVTSDSSNSTISSIEKSMFEAVDYSVNVSGNKE